MTEGNNNYRYQISEIRMAVGEPLSGLPGRAEKKLGLPPGTIREGAYRIVRESIDARDKSDIRLVYTLEASFRKPLRVKKQLAKNVRILPEEEKEALHLGDRPLEGRPVVVGCGPCGLFAALELARAGYRPVLIERGAPMEERIADVARFRTRSELDPESNMLFGEGGAGTFSDGKLQSGIKNGHIRDVLETFYEAGAGEDILYLHKPHIGTDVLREVIVNLRNRVVEEGGTVLFHTRLEEIHAENGRLRRIAVSMPERDGTETIPCNALILAIGHSARDTFAMIHRTGLSMEPKPFSIGVRMEHPQELIDRAQYGEERRLPPADYKLSYHASNGRGVYSFCMCPGGEVVVCSTREGELAVNGMSNRRRDSGTANSGILSDVRVSDFESDDVLAGVRYQEKYERLAFRLGNEERQAHLGQEHADGKTGFYPPRCTMKEFLADEGDGVYVNGALPPYAAEAIREAVPAFARKIAGYDMEDAVITAVETRSSSPVRILRGEGGESNIAGIYPAGEGAGYAGGITSAACDGIRAARRLIEAYERPEEGMAAPERK